MDKLYEKAFTSVEFKQIDDAEQILMKIRSNIAKRSKETMRKNLEYEKQLRMK